MLSYIIRINAIRTSTRGHGGRNRTKEKTRISCWITNNSEIYIIW